MFYSHEELSGNRSRTFYDRLASVSAVDWDALAAPLAKAFFQDRNGRPVDPVVYFKCFLVGYLEGIECDTDLAARVDDSFSIRRFLFGSVSGRAPDHSSLSRVRKMVAQKGDLEGLLKPTVELMSRYGLVGGEAVAIDTTLVPSRARQVSLPAVIDESPPEGVTGPLPPPPEEAPPIPREPEKKPPAKPVKTERERVPSSYDPDARIAKKPGFPAQTSYKIAASTDYANRAVVAADAFLSTSGEAACSRVSVTQTAQSLGHVPERVVADKGMDDSSFFAHVELLGAKAAVPFQRKVNKADGFGKERFEYDVARDVYICPAAEQLRRVSADSAERICYRAEPSVCERCALKLICLGRRVGPKSVSRHYQEESRERALQTADDPVRRDLIRKRKAVVEPVFADFKEHGGFRQIRTVGLGKARFKAKMGAIGWNLKIFIKAIESGKAVQSPPPAPKAAREAIQTPKMTRDSIFSALTRRFNAHFAAIGRL